MYAEERLAAWAASQPADNYVYVMECGHEYDESFRRTEGVFVSCPMHGPQRLISGPFQEPHTGRSACANCGKEVRTSFHDGRNFTYVHVDQGQGQCYVNGSFTGTRATPSE